MHKAFPLPVRKFPLPEGTSHCLKKNATAKRKVLPLPEVCTAIIVKEKPSTKIQFRSIFVVSHIITFQRLLSVLIILEDPDLSLQQVVSELGQLQFMGVEVEQDDLNQKFLKSLALEWLMHTIVWRNRSDLDTMSLDDLYNHLKIYKAEVQKKSEPNTQNMAFISSTNHSRGNDEVNTASVDTASSNVPIASANVATVSISQETA
nr:ribonuclease H-like domain-containing protein [Tanacetum cinerariifolium]